MTIEEVFGPQIIRRFNLYPAANVTGSAAPGASSGEALQTMARLAKEQFPETIGFDWSGVSLQESQAKGEEIYIFGLEVFWVSYRSSLPPEPLRPADGLSEQQSAVA